MNIRQLAIICHNATRPVRRVLNDEFDLKWGICSTEYQDRLIEMVQDNVDQTAGVCSMGGGFSRTDVVVSQIVGAITNALREELES
jgi:hypothetical protein